MSMLACYVIVWCSFAVAGVHNQPITTRATNDWKVRTCPMLQCPKNVSLMTILRNLSPNAWSIGKLGHVFHLPWLFCCFQLCSLGWSYFSMYWWCASALYCCQSNCTLPYEVPKLLLRFNNRFIFVQSDGQYQISLLPYSVPNRLTSFDSVKDEM